MSGFSGDGISVADPEEGRLVVDIKTGTEPYEMAAAKVGTSPQRLAVGNVIVAK